MPYFYTAIFIMRILFTCIMIVFCTAVQAQTTSSDCLQNSTEAHAFSQKGDVYNGHGKKWFISSYSGINAGYSFFRGGGASFMAAPLGVQLNRKLSNNVYAFVGVTAIPAFLNFNHAFLMASGNKMNTINSFYQPGNFSMYSSASLGLMYINDARTFSISGGISVERNNYPLYYNNQFNTSRQNNNLLFSK